MSELRMYNAEQKERFFNEANISAPMEKLFRNVFDFTAQYEEEKGADVCTWSEDEVKRVYELLSGFRSYSSNNRANLIKRYIKWCVENNTDGASGAGLNVSASGMKKFREMTLSGPEHLQKCLDSFLMPESEITTDNVLRGYCWLAFSGLSDFETVEVTKDDIDLANCVVNYNGITYPLYRQAIPCIKILTDYSAFKYYHPGYEDEYVWMSRPGSNKLLRGIRNAEPNVFNLRSKLSQKLVPAFRDGKTDVKVSSYRIWISGQFYRMFEKERMGEPVDFMYLAERTIFMKEEAGKKYSLEKGKRSISSKKRELCRDYQIDYERWKQIYSV